MDVRCPKESTAFFWSGAGAAAAGKASFASGWSREDTGDGAAAPAAAPLGNPAAMNLSSESYISAAAVSAPDTGPPSPAPPPLIPPPRKSSSFGAGAAPAMVASSAAAPLSSSSRSQW
uniref:Uncharacterized protein n=1 Tax=Arundo donax TaxID=35708 RepID=A0A0A9D149_ARUDO